MTYVDIYPAVYAEGYGEIAVDSIIPVRDLTTQDVLYGDRTTVYRWEVLEHSNGVDHLIGLLDGVADGAITWVQNAAVKGGGKVQVVDLEVAQPGMLRIADLALESVRLRPVMTINGEGGHYEAVPPTFGAWEETFYNYCPNPGFEVDFSNWSPAAGTGPRSSSNEWSASGARSLKVALSGNNSGDLRSLGGDATSIPWGLEAGKTYTFAATYNQTELLTSWTDGALSRQPRLMYFYSTNGIQFTSAFGPKPENAVGVQRLSHTFTIPANATGAILALGAAGGNPLDEGMIVYYDDVVVVEGTVDPGRIDGDMADNDIIRHFWVGAAGLSASYEEVRERTEYPAVWVTESLIPEIPWGVFLISAAVEEWEATGRVWSLEILDRCTVPQQDAFEEAYAVAGGTVILQEVRSILASSGEYIAIDETFVKATSTGMAWEAGTSKLKIINDLLDVAGYNALWMDGYGNFQTTPRVLPADRSITYEILGFPRELRDGSQSIYRPEWTRNRDSFDVPNKVIAVQAASGEDAEALIGVWTNEDASSPYSFQARGRWIPHVLDSVECPEGSESEILAFLEARARATLVQMSAVQAQVKVEHLPIPVRVSDVLQFSHTRADIDARHVITRIQLETHPLGTMQTTLQEVISL